MNKQSTFYFLTLLVFVAMFPTAGQSGEESTVDFKYGERGGLPEYCDSSLNEERKAYWKKKIGKTRGGLSHYCSGLRNLFLVNSGIWDKRKDSKRLRAAKGALKGFAYWQKRIPPDHWMMADIDNAFADAYKILGDVENERKHRSKAAGKSSGRPGSASAGAYIDMSDRMMKVGVPGTAVELLELALKLDPSSREIQRKLKLARDAVAAKARTQSGSTPRE